jgi:hypothetical protein
MARNIVGRDVRVDIGATYGAAIPVTDVSNASAAVVTALAHGLAEWSAGYFADVGGMVPLEGQGVIVTAPTTDDFIADGLDTSSYPPFADSAGFVPVMSWLTLAECTSYQVDMGGAAQRLNTTTILDTQARSKPSLISQQTLTLNLIPLTVPSTAFRFLQAATLAGLAVVIRITHNSNNALRVCCGDPSYPTEAVNVGAMGTSTLAISINVLFLQLAGKPLPPQTYSDIAYETDGYDVVYQPPS